MLSPREAAAQLGVCRATVYRLCEEKLLPHVRQSNSIYIDPRDLDAAREIIRKRGG